MSRTSSLRVFGGLGMLASAFGLYSIIRLIELGAPIIIGWSPIASWGIGSFFAISFVVGLFLLCRKTPRDDRPTR